MTRFARAGTLHDDTEKQLPVFHCCFTYTQEECARRYLAGAGWVVSRAVMAISRVRYARVGSGSTIFSNRVRRTGCWSHLHLCRGAHPTEARLMPTSCCRWRSDRLAACRDDTTTHARLDCSRLWAFRIVQAGIWRCSLFDTTTPLLLTPAPPLLPPNSWLACPGVRASGTAV